jgi:hypothetical protein
LPERAGQVIPRQCVSEGDGGINKREGVNGVPKGSSGLNCERLGREKERTGGRGVVDFTADGARPCAGLRPGGRRRRGGHFYRTRVVSDHHSAVMERHLDEPSISPVASLAVSWCIGTGTGTLRPRAADAVRPSAAHFCCRVVNPAISMTKRSIHQPSLGKENDQTALIDRTRLDLVGKGCNLPGGHNNSTVSRPPFGSASAASQGWVTTPCSASNTRLPALHDDAVARRRCTLRAPRRRLSRSAGQTPRPNLSHAAAR